MYSDPIKMKKVGPLTVELHQDEDGSDCDPRRDWDPFGTMLCFHKRYDLGDKEREYDERDFSSWDEIYDEILKDHPGAIVLPLYLYDHSGLRMKVGSFQGLLSQGHAEWDSGQVGFIYCTKQQMLAGWGKKIVTKRVREEAEACLRSEVCNYDAYLRGDIVGYVVKDEDGHVLDSCWGYVGSQKYALAEGVSSAEWHLEERAKQEAERRRTNKQIPVWEAIGACYA